MRRPTIILVHGAYDGSSSWSAVAERLVREGHRVIAYATPLRSIAADAAGLAGLVGSLGEPVVLVGHSYGGAVITNVPADAGDVVALVYVAAFALEPGESPADACALAPGATLARTLETVPLPAGGIDTYIAQDHYRAQFCADVPEREARIMAMTQRPLARAALYEPSGAQPLWAAVPSWFVFGDRDRSIPVGAHRIMARRARARRALELVGVSHAVAVSQPQQTTAVVLDAARPRTALAA